MSTELILQEQVANIATKIVAEVDPAQPLRAVAEELVTDEIGAVLVRGRSGPAGVISERDLVTVLATTADPWSVQAAEVMSADLVVAAPEDSIAAVGALMLDSGVRHVVVRDGERVVGMVSIRDVLRALLAERTARPAPRPEGGRP